MDFKEALTYQFKDENWPKKLILNCLLSIIPFYGSGWIMSVMKHVAEGRSRPIPEDYDISGNIMRGLKVFVIHFVYFFPFMIISLLNLFIFFTFTFHGADQRIGLKLVFSVFIFLICCIVGLFTTLVMPAAYIRFISNESIREGLQFDEALSMVKSNINQYLVLLLGLFVSSVIVNLGQLILVVGYLFTIPYGYTFYAHLLGQACKKENV